MPLLNQIDGITFSIITNLNRPNVTTAVLKNLINLINRAKSNEKFKNVGFEIICGGKVASLIKPFLNVDFLSFVDDEESANVGLLGKMRNNNGKVAKFNTLAFGDDDVFFPPYFINRLWEYSTTVNWKFAGCSFCLLKKELFEQIKWDETLPFYASRNGFKVNEDVDFSQKVYQSGNVISFDKYNTVYHYANYVRGKHCLDFDYILNDIKVNLG